MSFQFLLTKLLISPKAWRKPAYYETCNEIASRKLMKLVARPDWSFKFSRGSNHPEIRNRRVLITTSCSQFFSFQPSRRNFFISTCKVQMKYKINFRLIQNYRYNLLPCLKTNLEQQTRKTVLEQKHNLNFKKVRNRFFFWKCSSTFRHYHFTGKTFLSMKQQSLLSKKKVEFRSLYFSWISLLYRNLCMQTETVTFLFFWKKERRWHTWRTAKNIAKGYIRNEALSRD